MNRPSISIDKGRIAQKVATELAVFTVLEVAKPAIRYALKTGCELVSEKFGKKSAGNKEPVEEVVVPEEAVDYQA